MEPRSSIDREERPRSASDARPPLPRMPARRRRALAAAAVLALALSAFSFYATLRFNLGLWFALPGYLLALWPRLAFLRRWLEEGRLPGREDFWEAVAHLAMALSLVGGVWAWIVNLLHESAGPAGMGPYRANHVLAALLLCVVLLGRWRLRRLVKGVAG